MATITRDPARPATPAGGRDNRGGNNQGRGGRDNRGSSQSDRRQPAQPERKPEKKVVELPDSTTVRELATMISVSPINVIRELMNNGVMANINQQLDFDSAAIVAEAFGYEAKPRQVAVPSVAAEEVVVDPTTGKATPARTATLRQRLLA